MAGLSLMTNETEIKDDEYMTPKSAWEQIQHLIPRDKVIWEAFYGDGKSGEFLTELGFNVIHENIDFFKHNKGDIVVSNPPFTLKFPVLKRLKELNKPFILLLPASVLGTKQLHSLFGNELQVIVPNGRINWIKNGEQTKACWFASFYYCWQVGLPRDLLML
jgi:hypothetical protein